MKTLVLVFITSIILISCYPIEPESVIDGNFVGDYQITLNYGTDSAYIYQTNLFLKFSKGGYYYQADKYWMPPASSGKFGIHKNRIILTDNGRHNAAIDPTLLINGKFDYSFIGKNLKLTQQNNRFKQYLKINLNKIPNFDFE